MTPTETARLLAAFAGAWRIEIDDATAQVWANVLADVDAQLATEVAELHIKTEHFMPKPADFLADVRALKERDEREHMTSRNATAAYRCDGSRWRCAEHHGACPIDCEQRRGVEPCPTCQPDLYSLFQTPEGVKNWRKGKKHPKELIQLPACEHHEHEQPLSPEQGQAAAAAIRAAAAGIGNDWNETRRDLQ